MQKSVKNNPACYTECKAYSNVFKFRTLFGLFSNRKELPDTNLSNNWLVPKNRWWEWNYSIAVKYWKFLWLFKIRVEFQKVKSSSKHFVLNAVKSPKTRTRHLCKLRCKTIMEVIRNAKSTIRFLNPGEFPSQLQTASNYLIERQ